MRSGASAVSAITALPPIEWPIKVAFQSVIVERIKQILRHRG
jgi:hypothetical protein